MKAPVEETLWNRVKRHRLLFLVLLFVAVILGGYAAGFRPGPGLTVVRVGSLAVTGAPAGSVVYTDLASRGSTTGGTFTVPLVPGNHTVIVSAPNDEPFEKTIVIASNQTTALSPIFVLVKPTTIALDNSEQTAASASVAQAVVPTAASPMVTGCAAVYVADNRVVAAPATSTPNCATPPDYMCTDGVCSPTLVYAPTAPITGMIPFPGRTDAVIVATGQSVNVVGLDPRYPQYFAPVVKAVSPAIGAATTSASSTPGFYVVDVGHAYFIQL